MGEGWKHCYGVVFASFRGVNCRFQATQVRMLTADLERDVCNGPWWSCKLPPADAVLQQAHPPGFPPLHLILTLPHPLDPGRHWNSRLLPGAFPGSWRCSQSQCEECAGYSEMPTETCVFIVKKAGWFGSKQQGLRLRCGSSREPGLGVTWLAATCLCFSICQKQLLGHN